MMNWLKSFFVCTILLLALNAGDATAMPADTTFRIVESVPEATIYGQPGVPRTEKVWLDMINGAEAEH